MIPSLLSQLSKQGNQLICRSGNPSLTLTFLYSDVFEEVFRPLVVVTNEVVNKYSGMLDVFAKFLFDFLQILKIIPHLSARTN